MEGAELRPPSSFRRDFGEASRNLSLSAEAHHPGAVDGQGAGSEDLDTKRRGGMMVSTSRITRILTRSILGFLILAASFSAGSARAEAPLLTHPDASWSL